jgi:hypothetical protein
VVSVFAVVLLFFVRLASREAGVRHAVLLSTLALPPDDAAATAACATAGIDEAPEEPVEADDAGLAAGLVCVVCVV